MMSAIKKTILILLLALLSPQKTVCGPKLCTNAQERMLLEAGFRPTEEDVNERPMQDLPAPFFTQFFFNEAYVDPQTGILPVFNRDLSGAHTKTTQDAIFEAYRKRFTENLKGSRLTINQLLKGGELYEVILRVVSSLYDGDTFEDFLPPSAFALRIPTGWLLVKHPSKRVTALVCQEGRLFNPFEEGVCSFRTSREDTTFILLAQRQLGKNVDLKTLGNGVREALASGCSPEVIASHLKTMHQTPQIMIIQP